LLFEEMKGEARDKKEYSVLRVVAEWQKAVTKYLWKHSSINEDSKLVRILSFRNMRTVEEY